MKSTFACLIFYLILATPSLAQLPLDSMPVRVGGYVYDDQSQPISGATVTFTNQTDQTEYQGTTDPTGWYGNVGFSSVPDASVKSLLSQNYPNPFTSSTTVEIASQELEKSFGSEPQDIQIYDLRGRLVGSVPALNGTHDIQTRRNASLPNGAYFYKLGNEVRKMVGSPKRITVVVSGGTASGKALVQYRRVTEASGFEIEDVLVDLDDQTINFASPSLIPATTRTVIFDADPSAGIPGHTVVLTNWEVSIYSTSGPDTFFYELRNVIQPTAGMVIRRNFVVELDSIAILDGVGALAYIPILPGEDLGSTGSHFELPGTIIGLDNTYELMSAIASGIPFFDLTESLGIKQMAFDNDGDFSPGEKEWSRESVEKWNRLFPLVEFVEYWSSQGEPAGWVPGKFKVYRMIWMADVPYRGATDVATATVTFNASSATNSTTDEETMEAMFNANSSPFANSIISVIPDSYLKMVAVNNLSVIRDEKGEPWGAYQFGDRGIFSIDQLWGPNTPLPNQSNLVGRAMLDADGGAVVEF